MDEARITAGRNFSLAEWQQFFPGEPYRPTFPSLPSPAYQETHAAIARNLTAAEWEEHFPGVPYRATFPGLPVSGSAAQSAERGQTGH